MKSVLFIMSLMTSFLSMKAQGTIQTASGSYLLNFVGHGSLFVQVKEVVIHIDPWSKMGDYTKLPQADYVLITHAHRDHLDAEALKLILKPTTQIIAAAVCKDGLGAFDNVRYMANGEQFAFPWGSLDAVPAYNLVHEREPGLPFHPKGEGNGYVLSIDSSRLYVAGDTENIPEMAALKGVDVAFLPMNLPYTMTPEMAADAARMLQPKVLYPYHYGDSDTQKLLELLQHEAMDVRLP